MFWLVAASSALVAPPALRVMTPAAPAVRSAPATMYYGLRERYYDDIDDYYDYDDDYEMDCARPWALSTSGRGARALPRHVNRVRRWRITALPRSPLVACAVGRDPSTHVSRLTQR